MEEKKCNAYKRGRCLLTLDCANGNNIIESIRDRLCKNNPKCHIKQLQLKDKMIELMAKDIIWLGSNKDKKSNGKQIDIVLSNYKQQALAELSNNEM